MELSYYKDIFTSHPIHKGIKMQILYNRFAKRRNIKNIFRPVIDVHSYHIIKDSDRYIFN